ATFTFEAVRKWKRQFAPLLPEQLWSKRRGQAGQLWWLDETCIRVKGKWSSAKSSLIGLQL
ncbi:MAG TPA: hypothetical protein VFN35_01280, partial [Ktedonobacteraceae bacterium]|nr:hypothetical protein [Ktedonobacteraceae bacterium]